MLMRLTPDMQKRSLTIGERVMDLSQPDAIIQKSISHQHVTICRSAPIKRLYADQTVRLSPAELHSCRTAYDIAFSMAGRPRFRRKPYTYQCHCCIGGLPVQLLHMRALMNRARSQHLRPSLTHPPPRGAHAA